MLNNININNLQYLSISFIIILSNISEEAPKMKNRKHKFMERLVRIDKNIQYFETQLKNNIMPLSCVEQLKNLRASRQRNFKKLLECT